MRHVCYHRLARWTSGVPFSESYVGTHDHSELAPFVHLALSGDSPTCIGRRADRITISAPAPPRTYLARGLHAVEPIRKPSICQVIAFEGAPPSNSPFFQNRKLVLFNFTMLEGYFEGRPPSNSPLFSEP